MDRFQREALDRHITGNYGEDQFRDMPEDEDDEAAPDFAKVFSDTVNGNQGIVPEGYVPAFGVPYAAWVESSGGFAKRCPRCRAIIPAKVRKDRESFTGEEYARHYEEQHAAGDGWVLVMGEWYQPQR